LLASCHCSWLLRPGQVVRLVTRTYLVECVEPSPGNGTRVRLARLDDDAQGQPLEVVWELELDPEILDREAWRSIGKRGLDNPHHFSALLELLDPQRLTRGVKALRSNLDGVMVRRLKDDLRELIGGFPKRELVQVDISGLPPDAAELKLSKLLDQYRRVRQLRMAGATKREQAEAALRVSHLQQRLLSSVARGDAHRHGALDGAAGQH